VNTTSINGVYLGEASISFQDTNGGSHNGNFKSGLDSSHGNDKNVLTTHSVTGAREVGLFFKNGVLAARQIYPEILKTSLITVSYTWRIGFATN
jgi:hypothetical protein